MGKYINIIGEKFNHLTVLEEFASFPTYNGKQKKEYMVKCKCDCGQEITAKKGSVKSGNTKSCGCLRKINLSLISRKYHSLPHGVGAMRLLYSQYICGAKKRNIQWDLTEKQFKQLTSSNCFYCNTKPSQSALGKTHKSKRKRYRKNNGDYIYNGIGRIDSNKGYIPKNVIPCCGICNKMKMKMSVFDFYTWIKKVHSYLTCIDFQFPTGISFRNDSL